MTDVVIVTSVVYKLGDIVSVFTVCVNVMTADSYTCCLSDGGNVM